MNPIFQIRKQLEQIKPSLTTKYHLGSIGLFGSIVRDDFHDGSDVDILVDFDQPIGIEFIDMANELELLLQRRVDLVSKNGIKPAYLREIEKEVIYV